MKIKNLFQKSFSNGLKPTTKMTVSEWADTYRQLPADAAEPGRWRTARVPYMKDVMDAFTQDEVHRVAVKSAAQVSKTECLLNVVGRYVHLDPCAIMIVQPTLDMAQDFSKSRLSKMIDDTAVLTPLFAGNGKSRNAEQTILSKFFTGGRIVLQGANSAAGLASRPIRLLLCDEVDRFPNTASGNEGDPIDLAAKRQTTYWNYKTGLFSTPTQEDASRIDIEYNAGTCEEWQHKCPNCGEYHFLDFRQMVVDFEEKFDERKNKKTVIVNSVKWRCPDCGFLFDELQMKNAPQKYIAKNPEAIKNGVRSFHICGFSSTWLSWNLIMREWLEARGDPAREMVVYNTRFGLSYKLAGEYSDENIFLNRRENYPAELPEKVLLLTAGVDVQANRLEYEICGWSFSEECFGISRGIIRGAPNENATWQALDAVLDREYKFANGTSLKVARAFIDSGYSTKTVYSYCQQRRDKGRYAIKGSGAIGIPILYKYTHPKGYGIILTVLGVNDGKQEIMSRLGIDKAGAQYFHFPKDDEFLKRGYDTVYFKQLLAEHKVIRKSGGLINITWEPITSHARNESLDVRVYAFAAMKSCIGNLGERFWTRQAEELEKNLSVKNKKRVPEEKIVCSREMNIWAN
jgi:phage terminase large subunit GpA-like protein